MSLLKAIAVACLFGTVSIVLSDAKEKNFYFIVVEGKNDSEFSFTCNNYDRVSIIELKWKLNSTEIPECSSNNVAQVEACVEKEGAHKSILHIGKVEKGKSDGRYRCEHWWQKKSDKPLKLKDGKTVEITINVIKGSSSTAVILVSPTATIGSTEAAAGASISASAMKYSGHD
jgi:hypothetical protein